jgi:hypothetical protein
MPLLPQQASAPEAAVPGVKPDESPPSHLDARSLRRGGDSAGEVGRVRETAISGARRNSRRRGRPSRRIRVGGRAEEAGRYRPGSEPDAVDALPFSRSAAESRVPRAVRQMRMSVAPVQGLTSKPAGRPAGLSTIGVRKKPASIQASWDAATEPPTDHSRSASLLRHKYVSYAGLEDSREAC